MNETEHAEFASLIQDADTFPEAVGLVRQRDERIRRDARNAALEEAATDCDRQSMATGTGALSSAAYKVAASRIRAMKETT